MNPQTKISDAGWLCYLMKDGKWMPVIKLTDDQLKDVRAMVEYLQAQQ